MLRQEPRPEKHLTLTLIPRQCLEACLKLLRDDVSWRDRLSKDTLTLPGRFANTKSCFDELDRTFVRELDDFQQASIQPKLLNWRSHTLWEDAAAAEAYSKQADALRAADNVREEEVAGISECTTRCSRSSAQGP